MVPAARTPLWQLAPLSAVLGGLFGVGLLMAVLESVGLFGGAHPDGFTLGHYAALARDPEFLSGMALSVWVASLTTLLSLCLGLALAVAVHHRGSAATGWQRTLLQFPLAMPHLSLALVVLHLLSPSGIASRAAYALGLVPDAAAFPALVQDASGVGMMVAYIWKEAPFLAVVALTMLARISREYEDVARTLGAGWWLRWTRIQLPLIAPALIPAALAVFAYVFGAYEVPLLLGRTYPAMLGVLAERRFSSVDLLQRPGALAVAVTICVASGLLVWLYLRLARRLMGERPVLF